jgi:hypothetical protein
MPITTEFTNLIKQVGADAMCPVASALKIALLRPGLSATYDQMFTQPYVIGFYGDEVPNGGGYLQGGLTLTGRTEGPTAPYGWVDYDNPVWQIVGSISAIGAVIYDSTQANRVLGFIDFGGTVSVTSGQLQVELPGDNGPGFARVG